MKRKISNREILEALNKAFFDEFAIWRSNPGGNEDEGDYFFKEGADPIGVELFIEERFEKALEEVWEKAHSKLSSALRELDMDEEINNKVSN